jgi:prepilin-type N-terminal cleavage/methylation domain-containing protein
MVMQTQARENGFTLVETMVAMTLFAIGVLALAQVQFAASRNTMKAKLTTQATSLASDRIEQCVYGPAFADITEDNFPDEDYGEVAGGDERYARFTRAVTVEDSLDFAGRITLKTVTVQVTWNDINGQRNVELSSRVARF